MNASPLPATQPAEQSMTPAGGPSIPEADGAALPAGQSAMQVWSGIVQTPEVVSYFTGVFDKAGITVVETGEQFTVAHSGSRFNFQPGIDADVDFELTLHQQQVLNLWRHATNGAIGPEESWRIVQVLFTPLTRAALRSDVIRRNWLRVMAGVEAVIHVHLVAPNGQDAVTHTLAYAGDQWLVIPGLHGRGERTYWLNPDQALAFQRQIYKALKNDTLSGWYQFSNWYRTWRMSVSKR